jgi:hypothetical protein
MKVGLRGSLNGTSKGASICALIAKQRLGLCYRECIKVGDRTIITGGSIKEPHQLVNIINTHAFLILTSDFF